MFQTVKEQGFFRTLERLTKTVVVSVLRGSRIRDASLLSMCVLTFFMHQSATLSKSMLLVLGLGTA